MGKCAVEVTLCGERGLHQRTVSKQTGFLSMVGVFIATVFLLITQSAQAHNVIGGVYAIGSTVEGEVGFSNGDMAAEGTEVVISDAAGTELGREAIDSEGMFTYEASQRIDHYFSVNLSSGHLLDLILPADELPDSLPGGGATRAAKVSEAQVNFDGDQKALQALVEQAVAKQVKPLRKELAAYKEKAGFQDILGGIGYIFGLCGIGIWWRQRQREKGDASVS
ncbi:hypothetical protein [uncultured Neptuniibacter sp.]|uniref:hypothetical protein n=1 Tax=uncultured Neptuniibacter sp. TaxID=502143 RepID=UPI0026177E08|nr:hypothetical protein [uncultured Neptuniibacter sp.]